MTLKNHFQINRRLLSHPLWLSEPFTKGQAWVDLIGRANHSDGYFYKKNQRVNVGRGQCAESISSLVNRWKWSRGKVSRYLNLLENEKMIVQQRGYLTTIITICNYNDYQLPINDGGTSNGKANSKSGSKSDGHLTVHQTDIRRTSNGKHPIRTNNNQKELKRKNILPQKTDSSKIEHTEKSPEEFFQTVLSPVDRRTSQEFADACELCLNKLYLSELQIRQFYNNHSDQQRFIEAVRIAVEKTEKTGQLESPMGFMHTIYKEQTQSLKTRKRLHNESKLNELSDDHRQTILNWEELEKEKNDNRN